MQREIKQYINFYITPHSVIIRTGSVSRKNYVFTIAIDRLQKVSLSFTERMGLKIHCGDLKFNLEIPEGTCFYYEVEGRKYIDYDGKIIKEEKESKKLASIKEIHALVKKYFNVIE